MKKYIIFCTVLVIALMSSTAIASEWNYTSELDEFSDTSKHMASISALKGKGYAVALCDEESNFQLYFSLGEFIGLEGDYPVRYRIDKKKPKSGKWGVSTKGTSVFVSNIDKVNLARELLSGNRLLLEVKDYNGTSHQSKFSLKGASDAIGKVLQACAIERKEIVLKNIDPSVKKHISKWGPKSTVCEKEMLASLGYSISNFSFKKTPDVYYALQKYIDDKYAACGTNKMNSAVDKLFCKEKDILYISVYSDATEIDNSFKDKCGQLSMVD